MTGSGTASGPASRGDGRGRRERRRALEERLARDPAWRSKRREMAKLLRDPALGVPLAATLASELPWRLVAEAAADARVMPGIRQALDRELARRVPALSYGERVALARVAEPQTRRALAQDHDPRVLDALSRHPRAGSRERAALRARLVSVQVSGQPRRGRREKGR